jgi:hypothetical protein
MIQRHDLDVALSFAEIDTLRSIASYSHQPIAINHRDLLLSLGLVRPHNIFYPFILTEAGRQRLKEEDAMLESHGELRRPAADRKATPERMDEPLLLSRCRYVGKRKYEYVGNVGAEMSAYRDSRRD